MLPRFFIGASPSSQVRSDRAGLAAARPDVDQRGAREGRQHLLQCRVLRDLGHPRLLRRPPPARPASPRRRRPPTITIQRRPSTRIAASPTRPATSVGTPGVEAQLERGRARSGSDARSATARPPAAPRRRRAAGRRTRRSRRARRSVLGRDERRPPPAARDRLAPGGAAAARGAGAGTAPLAGTATVRRRRRRAAGAPARPGEGRSADAGEAQQQHLGGAAGVRGGADLVDAAQQHLPGARQHRQRQLPGHAGRPLGRGGGDAEARGGLRPPPSAATASG